MHIPKAFKIEDPDEIKEYITKLQTGLAHLVTTSDHGLLATPIPLYLKSDEGQYGTLYGHIAKANRQNLQHTATSSTTALVIFQGADSYISPTWYPSKQESHKVVPTWDYLIIHAHGSMEIVTGKNELLKIVDELTAVHEPKHSSWTTADAPDNFIDSMLGNIIGIKIKVTSYEASAKLSQDKPKKERAGVLNGINSTSNEDIAEVFQEFS